MYQSCIVAMEGREVERKEGKEKERKGINERGSGLSFECYPCTVQLIVLEARRL